METVARFKSASLDDLEISAGLISGISKRRVMVLMQMRKFRR